MKKQHVILAVILSGAMTFGISSCETSEPIEGLDIELEMESDTDGDDEDDFGESPQ